MKINGGDGLLEDEACSVDDETRQLWVAPEGDHNDPFDFVAADVVIGFLDRATGEPAGKSR